MYFAHFVSKISKLRHKKAFTANFRVFSRKNESGLRLLVSVLTRMALLTGASKANPTFAVMGWNHDYLNFFPA
jgi:hypothetical protein